MLIRVLNFKSALFCSNLCRMLLKSGRQKYLLYCCIVDTYSIVVKEYCGSVLNMGELLQMTTTFFFVSNTGYPASAFCTLWVFVLANGSFPKENWMAVSVPIFSGKFSLLEHVFITHNTWDTVGGLLEISLSVEDSQGKKVQPLHVHGPGYVVSLVIKLFQHKYLRSGELMLTASWCSL